MLSIVMVRIVQYLARFYTNEFSYNSTRKRSYSQGLSDSVSMAPDNAFLIKTL